MKKTILTFFMLFVLTVAAVSVAIEYYFIPDEINLTRGFAGRLEMLLPLSAEIENAPAMTVNSKPVSGNINIDLSKPVDIRVENEGVLKAGINFFGIRIKNIKLNVSPEKYVIPSGNAVGIKMDTDGVLVLGTGEVLNDNGEYTEPAQNILKSGDLIKSVDGKEIYTKEELKDAVKNSGNVMTFNIKRGNSTLTEQITPVHMKTESKIGVWVRDSTQGIGTITFIDPESNAFAALGHPVTDVDTGDIMPIKNGTVAPTTIKNTVTGKKGTPGELCGEPDYNITMGNIEKNTETGIYGKINPEYMSYFSDKKIRLANKHEVTEGDAYIISTVESGKPRKYSVKIDSVNKYSTDSTKNMTITITDKELLEKTGGIVQGMSGSPIIQNDCLVGAVTHVFVQQPEKGYAVFAENMVNNINLQN